MSDLQQLVATTCAEFEQIHQSSFLEDPASNSNLIVEIVEPAMVDDTPTMILIAPWTLSGIMFPPLGKTLPELVVGQRRFPVFENTLDGIGTYSSVNLVPDVGGFADRQAAQHAAAALAAPFREAVARALQGLSVADPGRRELFKRLAGSD